MATSQNPNPRRRPSLGDRSATGPATPPGTDPTPDTHRHDTGHPNARGTLPMARHLSTPSTNAPVRVESRRDRPTPTGDGSAGVSSADRAIMRARLAAMAAPRDSDSPRLAKLRAVLRDESLMAHVRANVEAWPPLSDEQRDTLAALLDRTADRTATRSRRRAA
ncbi:hypothetical protein [Verrucosispora sp. TAA-831]|uniref:hypothetical protein n=1 Tax=Verrucosispora sp. TAA-831 TaxID=3422227 RepID=UPI003D6ECF67